MTVKFKLLLRGHTESAAHIGHATRQLAFNAGRPPDAQGDGADLKGDGATVAVGSQTTQEISQGQLAVAGYLMVLQISVQRGSAQRPGRRTQVAKYRNPQVRSEYLFQSWPRKGQSEARTSVSTDFCADQFGTDLRIAVLSVNTDIHCELS